MRRFSFLALFIFVLVLPTLAPAEPLKLEVHVENGQLTVNTRGFHLGDDATRELERELAKDQTLIAKGQNGKFNLVIEGEALEKLARRFAGLEDKLNQEIRGLVQKQITPRGVGSRSAILSSHQVVNKDEHVEELTVVAGEADIYGVVDRLVVVGGKVRIHEGAKVTEEYTNVGGDVTIDPGAAIVGSRTEVVNWSFDNNADGNFFGMSVPWLIPWLKLSWFLLNLALVVGLAQIWKTANLANFDYVRGRVAGSFFSNVFVSMFGMIGLVAMALLFVISIVGILFLPFLFTAYFVLFLAAQTMAAWWFAGRLKLHRFGDLLGVALGFTIYQMVGLIPYLGFIKYLFLAAGFGAVVYSLFSLSAWIQIRREPKTVSPA